MIKIDSIVHFFGTHGQLRKSQRTTLAALVWAVLYRPLLGVSKIGHHLAMAGGTSAKHAIKRVDRFLGNGRINMTVAQGDLISRVLKGIREALITLDWTDPKDGIHQILSLNWRAHGRAIPLAWVTVRKDQLKDHMRAIEIGLLKRVAGEWPRSCHPILVADRGLGAIALFHALDALGWDWIIRGKGSTQVEVRPGVWLSLAALAAKKPVLRDLAPVRYGKSSGDQAYRCRIVIWAEPGYSDPWFLLVSRGLRKSRWPARLITAAYGQRFTTEECFRDQKNDLYEGFQLDGVKLGTPERWDRLLLVFAWAYYWLNVGGWAMERAKKDRDWKANTVDRRTHALWRLGVWGLQHGDVVWRTLSRTQGDFGRRIPSLNRLFAEAMGVT